MHPLLLPIITAVIGVILGYLGNQLPAIRDLPGKNAYLFVLLVAAMALSVILGALSDNTLATQMPWLMAGAYSAGAVLLVTAALFGWVIWQHEKRSAEISGTDTDPGNRRSQLLRIILNEVQKRQRENFKHLKPQRVIPLGLQDMPEQVGKPALIPAQPPAVQPAPASLLERVAIPVLRFFQRGNDPAEEIPPTRRLIDVFGQAGQRLLVLGKPGAGKTTLLLELAEQLLEQAKDPDNLSIPVILECSDWKDDRQTIEDWIVLQLKDRYNVPIIVSQQWLNQKQLIPLMDGLDELGLTRQVKAIRAIDEFLRKRQYPALVICCRREEFEQGKVKPDCLQGSVYLEPLSDQQIQTYLQEIHRPQLWEAMQSEELHPLLPEPSNLETDSNLPGLRSPLLLNMMLVAYQGKPIRNESELFQAYMQECFRQYREEHGSLPYSEVKTRHYLTWLARHLKAEKGTDFEIENLQPTWLEKSGQRWLYQLIGGLVGGLGLGLVFGLFGGLVSGLFFGLVGGLFSGIFFGISDIDVKDAFELSPLRIQRGLSLGFDYGLGLGLLVGLFVGPVFGLVGGLAIGLIIGLVLGPILGLVLGLQNDNIRSRARPNQGIWDTAKNTFMVAIVGAPTGILIFTLPRVATNQTIPWEQWPIYSLVGSLLISLITGLSLLQHGTLRFVLWVNGSIPWNYAEFLNYTSELRLIQQVGGRYRFVHSLLREHVIDGEPLPEHPKISMSWWQRLIFLVGLWAALTIGIGLTRVYPSLAEIASPSLQADEWVFFDQVTPRFLAPQRYDLISYIGENGGPERMWIVGLPGDSISSQKNQLFVNGQAVRQPYTQLPAGYAIEPLQVRAEHYFVVGRARDRQGKLNPYTKTIHKRQINGRFVWRLWPPSRFGPIRPSR